MKRLTYHTTTNIWLSLEDYHNAGLTSEETKEIIESFEDPAYSGIMSSKLSCRSMGFNGNWIISTSLKNSISIDNLVFEIERALDWELENQRLKTLPIQDL